MIFQKRLRPLCRISVKVRMYKIAALSDLKRHARTLGYDAFPILGAHICDAKFQYPDLTWKKTCGMIANLVGDSGCNRD